MNQKRGALYISHLFLVADDKAVDEQLLGLKPIIILRRRRVTRLLPLALLSPYSDVSRLASSDCDEEGHYD